MLADNEIGAKLAAVRNRIADAARRVSRDPQSVRLILASKTQAAEAIRAAYRAGARDFGENYVQEAIAKQDELGDLDIEWHLIGHLQTNKARRSASRFTLIHSLASLDLARALNRVHPGGTVRVLIEVNLGGEATKNGIRPDHVESLISQAHGLVDIAGLMTIPPPSSSPEHSRLYFSRLRAMRDNLSARFGLSLSELSMGMTDDFEVAIEEGATIVRVGRAVFGERTR
jgi:pyridoxal phosphate enzyme (YggS family)